MTDRFVDVEFPPEARPSEWVAIERAVQEGYLVAPHRTIERIRLADSANYLIRVPVQSPRGVAVHLPLLEDLCRGLSFDMEFAGRTPRISYQRTRSAPPPTVSDRFTGLASLLRQTYSAQVRQQLETESSQFFIRTYSASTSTVQLAMSPGSVITYEGQEPPIAATIPADEAATLRLRQAHERARHSMSMTLYGSGETSPTEPPISPSTNQPGSGASPEPSTRRPRVTLSEWWNRRQGRS